ncbi:hypothetical protein D6829_02475 [Candidatus Pacearchaeota archaeon]|nr:MAG: hypothetical protein D6829_02475 [Candidatus Pacearchaeota archaeon]
MKKDDEHPDNFFSEKKVPESIAEATQEEESSEWFIEEDAPPESVREIFLRPGSREDDEGVTTRAS